MPRVTGLALAAFGALVSVAFAQSPAGGAYRFSATLLPDLTMDWSTSIYGLSVRLTANRNAWFAIGFNAARRMSGGDAVLFQPRAAPLPPVVNATATLNAAVYVVPGVDAPNLVVRNMTWLAATGQWVVEFDRPLGAQNFPGAMAIPMGLSTNLIFAMGKAGDTVVAKHDFLDSGTGNIDVQAGTLYLDPKITPAKAAHGILMYASFGILIPLAMFSARFGDRRNNSTMWFTCHWGTMVVALLLACGGFGAAFAFVPAGQHLTQLHHLLGVAVMGALLLQACLGVVRPRKQPHWQTAIALRTASKAAATGDDASTGDGQASPVSQSKKLRPNPEPADGEVTTLRRLWHMLHALLGYSTYIGAFVNIVFGLTLFWGYRARSYVLAHYGVGATLLLLFLVMGLYQCCDACKKKTATAGATGNPIVSSRAPAGGAAAAAAPGSASSGGGATGNASALALYSSRRLAVDNPLVAAGAGGGGGRGGYATDATGGGSMQPAAYGGQQYGVEMTATHAGGSHAGYSPFAAAAYATAAAAGGAPHYGGAQPALLPSTGGYAVGGGAGGFPTYAAAGGYGGGGGGGGYGGGAPSYASGTGGPYSLASAWDSRSTGGVVRMGGGGGYTANGMYQAAAPAGDASVDELMARRWAQASNRPAYTSSQPPSYG